MAGRQSMRRPRTDMRRWCGCCSRKSQISMQRLMMDGRHYMRLPPMETMGWCGCCWSPMQILR
ncbi:hypothetical protein Egran_01148 [Elaphomyces granulatus]|uniref:Uncharacterized protein n=1 Tax=Elaphomyces granulatus TaxID=519963 RepID=A0A232M428_9EURO|nr:hypothetical protein Egran_01148 [Elaphomyces granulatus]